MSDSGRTPFKFFEGFLQHKGKEYLNYTDLWLVLKDSVIYIFTDSTVGRDTHIGKLTIDRYTEVHKRGGDDKSGYKFELFTGYGQTRKKNKFKSSKKVYMEMWRGYLEGLAVGTVPNDLDLLPDQVSQIQSDIDYFRNRPKSEPSLRSGNSGNARNRMSAADSGINVDGASMTTRSSGKTLGGGSDGGPTTRHKFTNDHDYVSDQTPSWFFENCSRQQAETILTIGKDYDNTLMRMSSTHKDHGSYVISKMFRKENRFEHFEVLRVANGYKINVENQHNAMSNLTEVMKFFVRTAGQHDTFPMKSNRMVDYGMKEEPDYATKFYNTQPESARESVNFKLASSEPEEPLPDYEEPVPRPNKTFTPGILKKEGSKYYHRQGSTGEAHLQHLDDVIGQFEPPAKEEEYVNQDFFNQARTGHFVNQPSRQQESQSPPLPSPHTPSTHSYNKEDPRVKNLRSKSVLNVAEQINQMKLKPARTDLTKTVTGDLPASVLRESQRVKSVQSSTPMRPKSFASFDNIPKTPLKLKQVSSPNLGQMSSPPVTDTTPEIDESALSPVDDIRKKFEVGGKTKPAPTTVKSPGKMSQNVSFNNGPSVDPEVVPPQRGRLMSAPAIPSFQVGNDNEESYEDTGLMRGTRQSFKKHLENMLAGKPPPIVKQNSLGSISSNTENKPQLQIPPLPTRSRGSLPPTPTLQEQLYEELPPNSIPEDETD